jgi:ribonuclease R
LIEEFMLQANIAVAERIASRRMPALYRIHEEPNPDQWEAMAESLQQLGILRPVRNRQDINRICREFAGSPMEYIVNLAILRNLKRALYSDRLVEHFGLGFPKYTHFTSPIRRDPDLLVHRLLKAAESGARMPYRHEDVRRLAGHCSQTERNADEAEEESLRQKCIEFYAARVRAGEIGPYPALITGVLSRGLLVELTTSLQRGLIPLHAMEDDHYDVQLERGLIRGLHTRRVYRMGDVVQVEIMRVDEAKRRIDFRLVGAQSATLSPRLSESGKSSSPASRRARYRKRGR